MLMDEQEDSTVSPMAAQDYSAANDWSGYFKAILGKGPRETLLSALDSFGREGLVNGFAVDLAAGEGRDTLELLHRGWKVLATDSHPEAFQHLWARVAEGSRSRLSTAEVSFAQCSDPCVRTGQRELRLAVLRAESLRRALEESRDGDSTGWATSGSVLRRARLLGITARSKPPLEG